MKLSTETTIKQASDAEDVVTNHTLAHAATRMSAHRVKPHRRTIIITSALIFLVACGVRFLLWQETHAAVGKVQSGVVTDYRRTARLLMDGGVASFFSSSSPLSDPNTLGHPPDYSILMALIFSALGESDAAMQFVQITADALAAVLILLIAFELVPKSAATIAGLLVALSPQFAWNSVLLLPDSLAVLPILLAIYCLTRALRRPRLAVIMTAGALIGISCWLRANAMLLAPFLALVIPFLFERGKRLRYAGAFLCGALLIIAPLTIRNAIVFRHFIPLSLGAGQTLLEGIADYDPEGRFELPVTDMGILKMEAEIYHRPDYGNTLFNPDGVARERLRLARGFGVIRSHPIWFFGVMIRRAASMLKLERARLVAADPPANYSPRTATTNLQLIWSNSPAELIAKSATAPLPTDVSLAPGAQTLRITGDDSKYGNQIVSEPIAVEGNKDYLLTLPVKLEQGRMSIKVLSSDGGNALFASTIVDTVEGKTPEEQPAQIIRLAFVSSRRSAEQIKVVLANEAPGALPPVAHVGTIELFLLGPAANLWTRYPRGIIRSIQKLFLTAIMLPLVSGGVVLVLVAGARARRFRALALLAAVPAYYVCVQSAVHTEYRYVLAVHYFFFALAAVSISYGAGALWRLLRKLKPL